MHHSLLQVLFFVDDNGNEVLSLGSMVKVSEETIRNILCRSTLGADEFVKFQVNYSIMTLIERKRIKHTFFQAALMWCKNNCDQNHIKFRKKMGSFLDYIQFKYIPCDVLVKDVYPLKIVPHYTMIRALAHQVTIKLIILTFNNIFEG